MFNLESRFLKSRTSVFRVLAVMFYGELAFYESCPKCLRSVVLEADPIRDYKFSPGGGGGARSRRMSSERLPEAGPETEACPQSGRARPEASVSPGGGPRRPHRSPIHKETPLARQPPAREYCHPGVLYLLLVPNMEFVRSVPPSHDDPPRGIIFTQGGRSILLVPVPGNRWKLSVRVALVGIFRPPEIMIELFVPSWGVH